MGVTLLSIRILLAAVFVVAAAGKLFDPPGSRRALEEFGVPTQVAAFGGHLLPIAELAVGVGLVFDPSARYAAIGAVVLLLAFVAGIAKALSRGRAPDCHCFGQIHSEPAGPSTIVRNVILASLAGVIVVAGAGPGVPGGLAHLSGAQVTLLVVAAVAIVLAVVAAQLWGERGRLRADLAAQITAVQRPGLPRGSAAPEFELTPVRGVARSLGDLTSLGRPVVLVFVSTTCGPCLQMLPELARWQKSLSGTLTLGAVFAGDPAAVERLSDEHGLSLVLAEDVNEVFESYALRATPSGLLISAEGKIDSSPAEGLPAVEALVRSAVRRAQPIELVVHSAAASAASPTD